MFLQSAAVKKARYRAYDLWQKAPTSTLQSDIKESTPPKDGGSAVIWGKDVGTYETTIPNVQVGAHSVRVFKLVPEEKNVKVHIEL